MKYMTKWADIWRSKKGSISMIGIIITLIGITVLSGFMAILNSSYVINEVEAIMELSSTNAIQKSIDTELLRQEMLGIIDPTTGKPGKDTTISHDGDGAVKVNNQKITTIMRNNYQRELNRNVAPGGLIQAVRLVHFDSSLVYSKWGTNYTLKEYGMAIEDGKLRPQIVINSVVQIDLKATSKFDGLNNYNLNLYNAFNGQNMTVAVSGVAEDGTVTLTVQTMARSIYR